MESQFFRYYLLLLCSNDAGLRPEKLIITRHTANRQKKNCPLTGNYRKNRGRSRDVPARMEAEAKKLLAVSAINRVSRSRYNRDIPGYTVTKTSPAITIYFKCKNASDTLCKTLQGQRYQPFVLLCFVFPLTTWSPSPGQCSANTRISCTFLLSDPNFHVFSG